MFLCRFAERSVKDMSPLLLISVLASLLSLCRGGCNVYPKDQYIELGSDARIFCQTSCVRGRILWTLNNRQVDSTQSTRLNASLWVLDLRNVTQPSATLQCHRADTGDVLSGTIIRTYTRPKIISCMLHSENQRSEGMPERLTCDWTHQMNSSQQITYTVLVSSPLVDPPREICSSHVTTCTATDVHLSDLIHLLLNFSVTVRAAAASWAANSLPWEFDPYEILKIIPPKVNVSVVADELLVEWRRSVVHRRTSCQVKYKQTFDNKTSETMLDTILAPKENGKVQLKWESCREYRVWVRCALDSAPWSDWSLERTLHTELHKRDVKLHLWRKITKPDTNGVRRVRVMWKRIPSTCPGNFTYTISHGPILQTNAGNETASLCTDSVCDVHMNQDKHTINLTVFQNQDPLQQDSVYVPAVNESLPQVSGLRLSAADGVIQVTWTAPALPVTGYMVDWTHDGNQYRWKESEFPNTSLTDLLDKRRYDVTVTPLFRDRTGGGSPPLGICSRVGDPGNITIVGVQANDRSVEVSWSLKSQEECSGPALNYTIFYGAQGESTLNVTVDSTEHHVFLEDLTPDTQHRVYVKASAHTGTSASKERLFKTKRFDPKMVVVGGSVAIALVLLGLCCAVQWRKWREKQVPDPGLSSVARWSFPDQQKGTCLSQAFRNPSESHCDTVYTEEMQITLSHPSDTDSDFDPAADQSDEYSDPIADPPTETDVPTHPRSPEESTKLLSSESPYRSQSSRETSGARTGKQAKCGSEDKVAPVTVYVTMNMLKEGQGR